MMHRVAPVVFRRAQMASSHVSSVLVFEYPIKSQLLLNQ